MRVLSVPVWRHVLSAVFATAGTVGVCPLYAQSSTGVPTRPRPVGQVTSTANACAELAAMPSPLVNAPEGMALLRFKRELESAVVTLEKQQQLQGADVQRAAKVQRGVDSLMQTVIVRIQRRDGPNGDIITMLRRDSLPTTLVGSSQMQENIRLLQPQITAFIAVAEAQAGRDVRATGYMGVGLLGAQVRTVTPDGVVVSHCDYPVVETVDAGSPASRAGVLTGDTVLAYNGRDVKEHAVNYQQMLMPGATVRVRVMRGQTLRDIPVAVTSRGTPDVVVGGPAPANAVAVVLGAQCSTVDDDFASVVGLEPGVLVLQVPQGSPFAQAGIRRGELIRSVNGTAVRDVQVLRRLLAGIVGDAGARDARLSVFARGSGTRTVTIRW